MNLEEILEQGKKEIKEIIEASGLEKWRVKFLGRKSALAQWGKQFEKMPLDKRREIGPLYNQIKSELQKLYEEKLKSIENFSSEEFFDYSVKSPPAIKGHLHPATLVLEEVTKVFEKMGFEIVFGPEIEDDYHNFEALNILKDHPARDRWDTLWLKPENKNLLLRTHTSPVQIRYLETHQPPIKMITPGRCFRHEATDSTHEMQFHQIEGLVVSENASLANFKYLIETAIEAIFKKKLKIRIVPDYFPFVSPGLEIDINCLKCQGRGCRLCGGKGWLEIMGAGMVHPKVFENVGYDKNKYQGFAFGLGLERLAMLKYGINDIRLFHSSDLRFLKQF